MTIYAVTFLLFTFAVLSLAVFSFPLDDGEGPAKSSWNYDLKDVVENITSTVIEIVTAGNDVSAMPFLVVPSAEQSVLTTSSTVMGLVTTTRTVTVEEPPTTVTISSPPTTVTEISIVSVTPTGVSYWSTPKEYDNLGSFKVTKFASGEDNLKVIDSTPSNDTSEIVLSPTSTNIASPSSQDSNSSSMLQILYPAGSIDPGNDDAPVGGSDFYAAPISLERALSVTFQYSVFFPANFSWILGGKLPGLYGGHTSCSGGNDATSCFSTRMMWREKGAGELYLYAPKDKQTKALCAAPPESVCDEEWGLSVGRGSFIFAAGDWTTIRQTVTLNTPGKQNGGFELEVNNILIMNRTDVYYRDASPPPSTSTSISSNSDDSISSSKGGGLLPPLIGGLFQSLEINLEKRAEDTGMPHLLLAPITVLETQSPMVQTEFAPPSLPSGIVATNSISPLITIKPDGVATNLHAPQIVTVTAFTTLQSASPHIVFVENAQQHAGQPIGFSGIFFSTFFGGDSDEYATPTDQYTWFKDFSLNINAYD